MNSLFTLGFSLLFFFSLAQESKQFHLVGQLKIEGEPTHGAIILVESLRKTDRIYLKDSEKFELLLDFNTEYTVTFSKDGYVSKSVSIDTSIPMQRMTTDFAPYSIQLSLSSKKTLGEAFTFVGPVSHIFFNAEVDAFDFKPNYTPNSPLD